MVLVLVSALSFGIIWLVPGDPTAVLLDANATPEQVARLRTQLGLDKSLPLQIVEWYGRILRGDLGQSILLNRSVMAAILERLPVTLSLAGIALMLAIVLGVTAGMIAAMNHNRWPDQVIMAAALFGLSVPDFWLALMMVFLLAVKFGLFPTGGFVPFQDSVVGWARSIAMPALALALVQMGFIARMARASMLEVLNQDFIRTADAKGLSRADIVIRHGLPNALVPILTVSGIVAGALLGGTVIIEQVFSLPGVGRLVIGAILSRDFPVIQGGLLFLAVIYLTVNLIVDLLYAVVDPRVRLQ
ncbi:MAG: ABC transporter permease [Pseudomonadota bacterium]|nr:ABC transporter permease [Pseudomonadota bacterium]